MNLALQLDGAYAVLKRDWLLFLAYRAQLVTRLLGVAFTLTLFHYISRLVSVSSFASPTDYFAFVVVGLVILQILQSTLTVATAVRSELVAGTFERVILSPFGPVPAVVSMLIFPFLMAVVVGVFMLSFAGLVFGLPVRWSTAWLGAPVAFVGALCFAAFALFFAALILVLKQTALGAGFVIAAVSIVAGFYFPVSLLPEWLQWATEAQPFTSAVDMLRHLLVGTPLSDPAALELTKLALFAVISFPLGVAAVSKAIRVGQRRGTIIEY